MTATQAFLWALVAASVCIAAGLFVGFVVGALRERAWQRETERRYADAWQAAHKAHQHDGRHTHDNPQRPE